MTTTIHREEAEGRGRYWRSFGDGAEAELTYARSGETLIVDHSFTPPAHRGDGAARRLVERAVADARAEGAKIRPLCPYVAALFRRRADWADVLER